MDDYECTCAPDGNIYTPGIKICDGCMALFASDAPDPRDTQIATMTAECERLRAERDAVRNGVRSLLAEIESERAARGRRGLGETLPRELAQVPPSTLSYLRRALLALFPATEEP